MARAAAIINYALIPVILALLLNGLGWLLVFTSVVWIPALILHSVAVHRVLRAYPAGRTRLWISTSAFFLFALARYDGSDAGGFTGFSCLLWRLGIRETSFVENAGVLQGVYLLLPVLVWLDWLVIRETRTTGRSPREEP